jgi:antitoxin VapB
MALNLKNPDVERMVDELAGLTGESKTETVRRALFERRDRLTCRITRNSRREKLLRLLEREIWPLVPAFELGKRLTREEEDAILGYGSHGV